MEGTGAGPGFKSPNTSPVTLRTPAPIVPRDIPLPDVCKMVVPVITRHYRLLFYCLCPSSLTYWNGESR